MPSTEPTADHTVAIWEMPFRFWSSWWQLCFSCLPSHRLTEKELEDKRHAQLVVPDPLKRDHDHELFA